MYVDKGIIYSTPGHYLHNSYAVGFQFKYSDGFTESILNISDMHIVGDHLYYNNNEFSIRLINNGTYEDYKTYVIKMRYSNDDQIAIILNRELSNEDLNRYDRMQQWREFASKLAKKITSVLTE